MGLSQSTPSNAGVSYVRRENVASVSNAGTELVARESTGTPAC